MQVFPALGNLAPLAGELFQPWEIFPRLRENFSSLGKSSPACGRAFPALGNLAPLAGEPFQLWETLSRLRESFSSFGKSSPACGRAFPALGNLAPLAGEPFQRWENLNRLLFKSAHAQRIHLFLVQETPFSARQVLFRQARKVNAVQFRDMVTQ